MIPATTSGPHFNKPHYFSLFTFHSNHIFPVSVSLPTPNRLHISFCAAAKSQTGPVKKRSPSPTTNNNKKKKRKGGSGGGDSKDMSFSDVEIVDNFGAGSSDSGSDSRSLGYHPTPLPKPPAGFVVDDHGKVLMASSKRIASIVSSLLNFLSLCLLG